MSIDQTPSFRADFAAYVRAGSAGRACVSFIVSLVVFASLVALMSGRLPSNATAEVLILAPSFIVVSISVEALFFVAFVYPRRSTTGPRVVYTPSGRLMTELLRPSGGPSHEAPGASDQKPLSKVVFAAVRRAGRLGGTWLNVAINVIVSDQLASWIFPGHPSDMMSGLLIRAALLVVLMSVEALGAFGLGRMFGRVRPKVDLTRC